MFKLFNLKFNPFMDELDSGSGGATATQGASAQATEETNTETQTGEPTGSVTGTEGTQGSEGTSGGTEPATQKKVQTPEENAAFAEMRRKTEAAERRAAEIEAQRTRDIEIAKKYGQYGVYSDADVAEKYGQSHGIKTIAEFEEALQREEREARQEELKAKGIDPEFLNKFVAEHPDVKQARETNQALAQERAAIAKAQQDRFLVDNFDELTKEFPEIAKADDVPADVWRVWRNGESGISLKQAYAAVNYESIASKKAEAAKQATLNNIQSKDHVRGNGKGAEGDTVRIPDEVLEMYKRFNPGKTMDEYRAHYKKSQN